MATTVTLAPSSFLVTPPLAQAPTTNLPALAAPSILDTVQKLPAAPFEQRDGFVTVATRAITGGAGLFMLGLGGIGALVAVADMLGCPPIPPLWAHELPSPVMTVLQASTIACLGVATLGLRRVLKPKARDVHSEYVVELARQLPLPDASASAEQRAVVAWVARRALGTASARTLSPEATRYADAVSALHATVDTPTMESITRVLGCLFYGDGRPRRSMPDVERLTRAVRNLEPDVRQRLVAYLRPMLEKLVPPGSSWRLDDLRAALEGKPYRLGDLASKDAPAPKAGTPERIRIDALDEQVESLLKACASSDRDELRAEVEVSQHVSLDQLYRLCGKYEDLGYSVALDRGSYLRLTVTTAH